MSVRKVVVYQNVGVNMKTIYKYPITSALNPVSVCQIYIPKNSMQLSIQIQNHQICLWALVNPDELPELREFIIAGTGNLLPNEGMKYLGTVQQPPYVWHIFERENF